MSKESDKILAKRILKIANEDAPGLKYRVTFKNMEIVFDKREYLDMLTARVVVKREICKERHLKDADEITDSDVYKHLLCAVNRHVIDVYTEGIAKALGMAHISSITEQIAKELEEEV
jgi:hypothetical protein